MAAVTPKPIDPNPAAAAKRRRQFQQFANRVRQGVRGANAPLLPRPGKPPLRGVPLTRMPIPPGASRGSGDDRTFGPGVNRKGPSIVKSDHPPKGAGRGKVWDMPGFGPRNMWPTAKGVTYTGAKPQVNRNTSAETGKKSANWGEKYGVGVDRKGREIHVYSDGRTVQAHSDAFYKANPDALKPPPAPNSAKGKTSMHRKPPPVPGAANRKGLLAQFNKRLKHKPKTRGRHGPPGFGPFPKHPTGPRYTVGSTRGGKVY